MKTRSGFVLIAALWMLVAFSVITLHYGLTAATQRLAVNNMSDRIAGRAAALAALTWVRHDLSAHPLDAEIDRGMTVDSWRRYHRSSDTITVGTVRVLIRYSDAGSRFRPRGAGFERTRAFFRALTADSALADSAAAEVARTSSSYETRIAGCVGSGWVSNIHGRVPSPRVTTLARKAVPELLCQGTGRVNIQTATEAVLQSLPGVSPAAARAIIAGRAEGRVGSILDVSPSLNSPDRMMLLEQVPVLLGLVTSEATELLVQIEAYSEGASHPVRLNALLLRTGAEPVVSWQRLL